MPCQQNSQRVLSLFQALSCLSSYLVLNGATINCNLTAKLHLDLLKIYIAPDFIYRFDGSRRTWNIGAQVETGGRQTRDRRQTKEMGLKS